jgi:outer membrane protein OmpA-like peptidoglycan-associated protein
MLKTILLTVLIVCFIFAGNVFAKTRQHIYNYGKGYLPALTYVFQKKQNLTVFKKSVPKRVHNGVAGALKKMAYLLKGNASAIHTIKFKPVKFTVYGFKFNSFKINKMLSRKLNKIKKLIAEKKIKVKSITGYTDHFGTKAYNNKLALERAKSAESYLGLKNIKLYGYGKCCYISKINLKDRRVIVYGLEKF